MQTLLNGLLALMKKYLNVMEVQLVVMHEVLQVETLEELYVVMQEHLQLHQQMQMLHLAHQLQMFLEIAIMKFHMMDILGQDAFMSLLKRKSHSIDGRLAMVDLSVRKTKRGMTKNMLMKRV